ncbi:MAG: cytochrome c peroxidase [Bacteroidota bacterium]
MKRTYTLVIFAFVALSISSCVKDEVDRDLSYYTAEDREVLSAVLNLPLAEPDDYNVTLPTYVAGSGFRINRAKATLGRVLFYDKNLSQNNAVSCASCHNQGKAFADPVAKSEGFQGQATLRNSYAIGSTASTRQYYDISRPTLFWDSRARTVAAQSTLTIQDAIEMGMHIEDLPPKLADLEHYKVLFNRAYWFESGNGSTDVAITKERILECIEEFVLSFSSHGSKFDKGYAGDNFSTFNPMKNLGNFTKSENLGKELFMNNCSGCHGQTFTLATTSEASNGLDEVYTDKGIGGLDDHPMGFGGIDYEGVFKTPILRNVELTAPYMHDGRFATLEDVVEHYSSGIQKSRNLHPLLRQSNGEPKRFNFSAEEKTALVDFLKTLTDQDFITDSKFSDPFIK